MDPLRPYQAKAIAAVYQREKAGVKAICLQGPTGCGKSRMVAQFLIDGKPQIALTHRRTLLDQWANVLTNYGIPFGFRANGRGTNLNAPIQLGMVQSEYSNAHKRNKWPLHQCSRLFIDEIHTVTAVMAQSIVAAYRATGATFIGTTATPSEIGHLCDEIVVAATIGELVEQGYLSPVVAFTPDGPGIEKLESVERQANGEFSPTGLEKVWDAKTIFGRVVEHYRLLNPTYQPAVLFAQGVKESLWFAQRLSEQGIRSAHIDGDCVWLDGEQFDSGSDGAARQRVFDGLRDGSIKCVCNRFVLREGWDLPEIAHVIMACIVGTRSTFMQMVGRGMRAAPGKTQCVLQDHGGNVWRWPTAGFDDPWDMSTPAATLEKIRAMIRRGDSAEEHPEHATSDPIVCPKCYANRISGRKCFVCGFEYEKRSRPVIQLDGSLSLETGPMFVKRRISKAIDDAYEWERAYWGAKKNSPTRTFEQVYAFYAHQHNWRWLPRKLPLMPKRDRHWFSPVGEVEISDLYPKERRT